MFSVSLFLFCWSIFACDAFLYAQNLFVKKVNRFGIVWKTSFYYTARKLLKRFRMLREQPFLMPGTRAEGIFEELKKFLSPGRMWQKVLLPQYDLLESLVPLLQRKIQLKKFSYPFYNFAIVFVPLTSNKKHSKEFNSLNHL